MYKYLFHCETIRSSLSEATIYRYPRRSHCIYTQKYMFIKYGNLCTETSGKVI